MTDAGNGEIKEAVKARYAKAIVTPSSCCGPSPATMQIQTAGCCGAATTADMKGSMAKVAGYSEEELAALPADAVCNSFGCGNPLAFAGVRPGQTVLDIGSGAGIDCFLAARKVGPSGRVIGLDMTPEMVERGRENARAGGYGNVEFRLGDAEKMPVEDGSVDWVISNCVINLSPDKPAVFREIARILRPGGRISISDIVAEELPEPLRRNRDAWTKCLAGAISEADYRRGLQAAGLGAVRVTDRIAYDASKLTGLFASSVCGVGAQGAEAEALARAAAGKIWSARFEGVKTQPAGVAAAIGLGAALPAEVPAIQALLREADLPSDIEEHWREFVVARYGDTVIGCIGMEQCGAGALFRSLAVAPAYQGLGLAQRLYAALEDRAKARGVTVAYLLTKTIEPLAEKWGFRRVARAEVPDAIRATREFAGECCTSAVALSKPLAAACCGGTG